MKFEEIKKRILRKRRIRLQKEYQKMLTDEKVMKDDKMKIMCKWCNVSMNCHIVSEEVSDHHGAYGIDSVKMAKTIIKLIENHIREE